MKVIFPHTPENIQDLLPNQINIMEQQIVILEWLQDNEEILNHWYNNKITSEDVVKKYKEDNTEYKYYLLGEDAVIIYNTGYEDNYGNKYEGAKAVLAADEDNSIIFDVFREEVGFTTIQEFKDATDGWMDSILISKEDYINLK